MWKNFFLIQLIIILHNKLYCNDVFSLLTDGEIFYGTLRIAKQYSIEKKIDVNLFLYNIKYDYKLNDFNAIITSKQSIIDFFKNQNQYIIIDLPFFDFVALCSERERSEEISDLSLENKFDVLKKNYILVVNNNYNKFFPDFLNDFDLHHANSSQHSSALIINGKTFGITNHTECINHLHLKENAKFLEKKINFTFIIDKKYQYFIDYFWNNLNIFRDQGYIFED